MSSLKGAAGPPPQGVPLDLTHHYWNGVAICKWWWRIWHRRDCRTHLGTHADARRPLRGYKQVKYRHHRHLSPNIHNLLHWPWQLYTWEFLPCPHKFLRLPDHHNLPLSSKCRNHHHDTLLALYGYTHWQRSSGPLPQKLVNKGLAWSCYVSSARNAGGGLDIACMRVECHMSNDLGERPAYTLLF